MDACCLWCHQSSAKADKCTKEKVFNQNFSKSQDSRFQPPQGSKNIKTLDRSPKNNRNNKQNRNNYCDYGFCGLKPASFIPATRVNITNTSARNAWNRDRLSKERTGTGIMSPITIVIRKGILLISALSSTSQKTRISVGDLHVGNFCSKSSKDESF